MLNYCPECGMKLIDPASVTCPGCGRRLQSGGGWLSGLLGALFSKPRGVASGTRVTTVTKKVVQTYRIKDPQTGEMRVYHNLNEMPPNIRKTIEAAQADCQKPGNSGSFRYRDPSGMEQSYNSLDEMPPEVRKVFEDAQQNKSNP